MVRYVIPRIWAKLFIHPSLQPVMQTHCGEIEMQRERKRKKRKREGGRDGPRKKMNRERWRKGERETETNR